MIFNYEFLVSRIREKYKSINNFATASGILPVTLYYKLNNNSQFKQEEIITISKLLKLKDKEIKKAFFEVR